ncbi:hypothetical protein GCM10010286_47630 [Streptomyces toxytricini]|nr:hypothetical protein GCM10010286_47630 [Streptomyces toxytricini]
MTEGPGRRLSPRAPARVFPAGAADGKNGAGTGGLPGDDDKGPGMPVAPEARWERRGPV